MGKNDFQGECGKLTEQLIGMAMRVHGAHGPGLDEKAHENSMCIEMAEGRICFTQQEIFNVFCKGRPVSRLITDLIVDHRVILENRVFKAISDLHVAQVLSFLAVTKLRVGLIPNFGKPSLEFPRVVRFT